MFPMEIIIVQLFSTTLWFNWPRTLDRDTAREDSPDEEEDCWRSPQFVEKLLLMSHSLVFDIPSGALVVKTSQSHITLVSINVGIASRSFKSYLPLF